MAFTTIKMLPFGGLLLLASCDKKDPLEQSSQAAIFGDDDRKDYFESSARAKSLAESVYLISYKFQLPDNPDGSVTLVPIGSLRSLAYHDRPGPDENFLDQQTLGSKCTAFAVGPYHVATAWHCEQEIPCFLMRLAGHVWMNPDLSPSTPPGTFVDCEEIAATGGGPTGSQNDWVILRTKQPVLAPALPISTLSPEQTVGRRFIRMGHGLSLPLKIDEGARTAVKALLNGTLLHNSDAFVGDSGSPLIDFTTGEVIGIDVFGPQDPYLNAEGFWVSRRCDDDTGCGANRVFQRAVPAAQWKAAVPDERNDDCP